MVPPNCSMVAQPFPQRHVYHLLTRELGRAQISTAQPFLGGPEPGPDGCRLPLGRLSEADHPCSHGLPRCSCLSSFLLLPSTGLAICHLLPWPPRTPAIARSLIRLPHQPRLPLLQPLASSCPVSRMGPVGPAGSSQEALPSVLCREPARRPEGPGPAREIRSSQPPAVFIRN